MPMLGAAPSVHRIRPNIGLMCHDTLRCDVATAGNTLCTGAAGHRTEPTSNCAQVLTALRSDDAFDLDVLRA
jgi:hypothetical protein